MGGEAVEEVKGKKQQGEATAERPLWASPSPLLTTGVKPPAPAEMCSGRAMAQGIGSRSQGNWRWEGPLGTPLGLVHWKRASSPVEAGTSGFL